MFDHVCIDPAIYQFTHTHSKCKFVEKIWTSSRTWSLYCRNICWNILMNGQIVSRPRKQTYSIVQYNDINHVLPRLKHLKSSCLKIGSPIISHGSSSFSPTKMAISHIFPHINCHMFPIHPHEIPMKWRYFSHWNGLILSLFVTAVIPKKHGHFYRTGRPLWTWVKTVPWTSTAPKKPRRWSRGDQWRFQTIDQSIGRLIFVQFFSPVLWGWHIKMVTRVKC